MEELAERYVIEYQKEEKCLEFKEQLHRVRIDKLYHELMIFENYLITCKYMPNDDHSAFVARYCNATYDLIYYTHKCINEKKIKTKIEKHIIDKIESTNLLPIHPDLYPMSDFDKMFEIIEAGNKIKNNTKLNDFYFNFN